MTGCEAVPVWLMFIVLSIIGPAVMIAVSELITPANPIKNIKVKHGYQLIGGIIAYVATVIILGNTSIAYYC